MWLYTSKAFFSVVENYHDKTQFLVRGRYKGDIEAFFPDAKVDVDAGTDYKYRAYLPKKLVQERYVEYMEKELNYTNFKNSVTDNKRLSAYHDVWHTMLRDQSRSETANTEPEPHLATR
jgi:hypothetical protein